MSVKIHPLANTLEVACRALYRCRYSTLSDVKALFRRTKIQRKITRNTQIPPYKTPQKLRVIVKKGLFLRSFGRKKGTSEKVEINPFMVNLPICNTKNSIKILLDASSSDVNRKHSITRNLTFACGKASPDYATHGCELLDQRFKIRRTYH
jgi:hypothetical protein